MNNLRRAFAVMALSLTLAIPAFAGIIHSTGAAVPPQPPPSEIPVTSSLTTSAILTILGLLN